MCVQDRVDELAIGVIANLVATIVDDSNADGAAGEREIGSEIRNWLYAIGATHDMQNAEFLRSGIGRNEQIEQMVGGTNCG